MRDLEHDTHLTQLSGKLRWALTHESVQHCVTLAAVLTWSAIALVPLNLTASAHETWRTQAVVTPRDLLQEMMRASETFFFFFLVKVCAAMLSAKQPVEARTLHVAPFWHWPWQPLLPEEEEELIIKRNVRLFPRSSSLWGHFSGAVYTLGCAQIRSKFGKETSGAKRVPDKPLIDCDWACTGSGERYWHASSVMMAQLPAEFCQEEKETGYHMWEKWVKTNYT